MVLVECLFGNVLLFGEMGIGNILLVSLLMVCLIGLLLIDCVGCGMGLDDVGLVCKFVVLVDVFVVNVGV